MQLSTRVIWSGQASPAEAGRFHSEVTAIFLDEDIGGQFGNSKQTVQRLVDRHGLWDSRSRIAMGRIQISQRESRSMSGKEFGRSP